MTLGRPFLVSLVSVALASTASAQARGETKGGVLARKGDLGLTLAPPSGEQAAAEVTDVVAAGPAGRAGIRKGDRLAAIGGRRIESTIALADALNAVRFGKKVALEVMRDQRTLPMAVLPARVPEERIAGLDVVYGASAVGRGYRVRTIVTKPTGVKTKLPALFLTPWLSCDSVEGPPDTDGFVRFLHGIAKESGFVLMRVEKPGVGDSEGPACSELGFDEELDAYRAAYRDLAKLSFVDPERIFILGLSNGGGFAPLVVSGQEPRGYVVVGGWVKSWFEHMMEYERRRVTLLGKPPEEITSHMKGVANLYVRYLSGKKLPGEVIQETPSLAAVWDGPPTHQWGRPARFFHELQSLDLLSAWSNVRAPVLTVRGEHDWVMSREDYEILAATLNAKRPGQVRHVEFPRMDHFFLLHGSIKEAFKDEPAGTFASALVPLVADWLREKVR